MLYGTWIKVLLRELSKKEGNLLEMQRQTMFVDNIWNNNKKLFKTHIN